MKKYLWISALFAAIFILYSCESSSDKESQEKEKKNGTTDVQNDGEEDIEFEQSFEVIEDDFEYMEEARFNYEIDLEFDILKEGEPITEEIMSPYDEQTFREYYGKRELPPVFDFNVDPERLSLAELRILRNSLFARKGYLFKDAIIRGYFNGKDWYQPPFWENDYQVNLTPEESKFVEKIKRVEEQKLKNNYVYEGNRRMANLNNVMNYDQFENLNDELMEKLKQNNFAIVPNKNIQLFHTYERNDYNLIPNFITTDLFLQLYHMYFSYALRQIEKEKFIPILDEMVSGLHKECMNIYGSSDGDIKKAAGFNACYYAIAYYLLTDKKLEVPSEYENHFNEETQKAKSASGDNSKFMQEKEFAFSLFKPRGHYTRDEGFKSYFRAMMWLQTAKFSYKKDEFLSNFIFSAYLLKNSKSEKGTPIAKLYKQIFEPVVFLVGEPDNLSILDIIEIINSDFADNELEELMSAGNLPVFKEKLAEKEKVINKIYEKDINSDKAESSKAIVNFMPQRYLFDNEILLAMQQPGSRSVPRAIDIFAVLGSTNAKQVLIKDFKEIEAWEGFTGMLEEAVKEFNGQINWNKSNYNKWMESLAVMLVPDESYPPFMKTRQWGKKNLNTALASYAELKHDVILYAEQPMAAECGDWGPDQPVTPGYVEPNLKFWNKAKELLKMTEDILKTNDLYTDNLISRTERLGELLDFLIQVSEKELNGEKLNDEEFETIRVMGSTVEYMTLNLLDNPVDSWYLVEGPDRMISVVADIFTNTTMNKCIEEGVGFAHDIYVVVEINGYMYIAKGAVFSYYEFLQDASSRLTDEEWQEMLKNGDAPDQPIWMDEIVVPMPIPEIKKNYYYSSGC